MSAVRLFVGVALEECMLRPLLTACAAVRDADHSWRDEKWVAPQLLHLTLKFIGWVDEGDVATTEAAVSRAVESHARFALPFVGMRPVPHQHRCRMLWGKFLDPDGACASLVESIERELVPLGIEPESRPYKPHVTLVRARRPKPLKEEAIEAGAAALATAPHSMSVLSATLFSSQLTQRGPIYSTIGSWHLSGE